MKIVVAEKISASAVALLQEPRWTVLTPDQIEGKLTSHLESADALIVRSAVQVDAALLDHAPKLRVVGRAGVGVDNVDLEAATRKGIAVMNTPGANAVAVAELTLGLMLSMARFIPRADGLMHAGKWEKKSLQGTELRGKTLGSSASAISAWKSLVAPKLSAWRLSDTILLCRQRGQGPGHPHGEIEELYAAADYLTLHVGLTPQTTGMINADSIKKMKKGMRLVNCARGELVDEAALAHALKNGSVGGAALDVFQKSLSRTLL